MNYSYSELDDVWKDTRSGYGSETTTGSDTIVISDEDSTAGDRNVIIPRPGSTPTSTSSYFTDSNTTSSMSASPVSVLHEDDFKPEEIVKKPKPVHASVPGPSDNHKIMRHILRIRDDVRQMLRDRDTGSHSEETTFPLIEIGLFIAVGLFILISMQMMIHLKHDVFSSVEPIIRETGRNVRRGLRIK